MRKRITKNEIYFKNVKIISEIRSNNYLCDNYSVKTQIIKSKS